MDEEMRTETAHREGCGSRDGDGQEADTEVCHHQSLEQRVPQLLCCSPAPGNASDGAYRTDTHVLIDDTSST